MITTAIITKVYGPTDKDKDGKPLLTKATKKPYRKMAIKTDKTGEDWWGCLLFRPDSKEEQLKEGDEVKIDLFEENGFKNFRLPSKTDLLEAKVDDGFKKIIDRIKTLEQKVGFPSGKPFEGTAAETVSPDEVPWP